MVQTKWKCILIVVAILLIVGGIFLLLRDDNLLYQYQYQQNQRAEENLYGCNSDTECVLVKSGYCGTVLAVNKEKETEWKEKNAKETERAKRDQGTCKPTFQEYIEIKNFKASCQQSRCKTVFVGKLQEQNIDTSNWQTYRNDEFGFEVKYPSNWDKEDGYLEPHEVAFSDSEFFPPGSDVRITFAQFSINSKEMSQYFVDFWNSNLTSESGRIVEIGGVKALEQNVEEFEEAKIYSFVRGMNFYQLQTRIYDIDVSLESFVGTDRTLSSYRNIFDQILSTFRFVDSEMSNSGIMGTTRVGVISGVPGGESTVRPASLEFAIAPIEGKEPRYDKAIFITSDTEGKYEVFLPPGKYWIGSKVKASDPINYVTPESFAFSEKSVVVVEESAFILVDLSRVGLAP